GLEALYLENGKMVQATAKESPSIQFKILNSQEYKSGEITAVRQIQLKLDNGNPSYAETDGRSTIELDADTKGEATSNKKLSADKLIAEFFPGGKNFRRTRAIGNAELVVEPLVKNEQTYRTVVNSPEFDCTFFENVNAARQCVTGTPANALREPSTKKDGSGIQKLSAAKMSADFDEKSRDVAQLKAEGGAKFNELDKNGVAREIIYTASDGVIRLRGGEPTGWDSNARIRAKEIDINTRDQKSFAKGAVSTTYYSQKQTNSSTPFTSAGKPVFITADSAVFDDKNQSAVYEGNARAWQENNYVRADKFMIDQASGKFQADGKVQSLLFEAPRIGSEKSSKSPVSALADSLLFLRDERKLIYTGNVNIRQAGDRIVSGRAEIIFDEKGEVAESNFSENVTISQPGRRAFADFVTYSAAKNEVILRGQPVRVEDSENGSTSAGELRINTVNNQVASEGKQMNNPSGRSRTVYKIKPN
ncbi:MAG TPA: LptA/OstA family protein, partial [Pyrinomonadaceae bacterium]|nr:LptA/OstA family protein [Pyrinomonadaceae bacterium]